MDGSVGVRTRILSIMAVAIAAGLASESAALAVLGSSGGSGSGGSISAAARVIESGSGESGSGAGPLCKWTLAQTDSARVSDGAPVNEASGLPVRVDAQMKPVVGDAREVYLLYYVACGNSGSWRYYLPEDRIDRQAVIDQATDEMTRILPLPDLAMWPPPEVGAPVQLGLWMAVNDPGEVSAWAQAGPVWAIVTARLTSTRWDMGNGDAVDCAGVGEPYPHNLEPTDYRQGPCGYTYEYVADLGFRQVTSTTHWDVQLETSDGVNEPLTSIDRSTSFDYEIYEIVTVIVESGSG